MSKIDNNTTLDITDIAKYLRPIRSNGCIRWENRMMDSSFSASEIEMKLIMALSAQVRKITEDKYTIVSAKDLGKLMNLDTKKAYSILKQITRKLFNRTITFRTLETLKSGKPKKELLYHIFEVLVYDNEHSAIGFKFSAAVEPLIVQVKTAYASVPVKTAMILKGAYTNRLLLDIVKECKNTPWIVSLDYLRLKYQVGERKNLEKDATKKVKTYARNTDFVKVLCYSAEQIEKHTNYRIHVEQIKTGRTITHLRFDITQVTTVSDSNNVTDTTATDSKLTEEQQKLVDWFVQNELKRSYAVEYIETHSVDDVKVNMTYALDSLKKAELDGKIIKSKTGYIRACLDAEYGVMLKKQKEASKTDEQKQLEANIKQLLADAAEKAVSEEADEANRKAEKDRIKADFLAREDDEKKQFVEYIKASIKANVPPIKQVRYKRLLDNDIDYILADDTCIDLIVSYSYSVQNIPIPINNND